MRRHPFACLVLPALLADFEFERYRILEVVSPGASQEGRGSNDPQVVTETVIRPSLAMSATGMKPGCLA